jgi:hypothetical protein
VGATSELAVICCGMPDVCEREKRHEAVKFFALPQGMRPRPPNEEPIRSSPPPSELLMLDPRFEIYPTIEYRPIQPSDLEALEKIHLALFPIRYLLM